MPHVQSRAHAARGADAPASCDPLAPLIDILDEAHCKLTAQDLAGVLFVDRFATALSVAAIAAEAQHAVRPPATDTGSAYQIAAVAQLNECRRAPRPGGALAECAHRLHAYV